MVNFNHLYYFHVTATEGSVKAAAERLGVTQPTVSEQIRMLERSLGVQLFERASTGLRLTQAGRDAFEHSTTMFLAGERLVVALGRASAAPAVALKVGMSAVMARTIAADFLMPVLTVDRCHPSIRTGDFHDLLRDLRSHQLDLVLGETEPLEVGKAELEVTLVQRPELVALVHPDSEPGEDWQSLSLLEYRVSSAYHWEVERFLREKGLRPKSMGELDDAFLMLEAVQRGGFVAFVPKSLAREALRTKRVVSLASFAPNDAGVYAVYHKSDALQTTRDVVEQLIANAREELDA